jgi:transcriptional regulator with XRE-family HTH domain
MESIHQRIKRLREKKRLTQVQLAELVGVRYQSVQEWEENDGTGTAPQRKRLQKVADALGVSLHELMTGSNADEAPTGAKVDRIIKAFGWLTEEQQNAMLQDLEAKAETNKAISRELGARWEFKPDAEVANYIAPAPKTAKPRRTRK